MRKENEMKEAIQTGLLIVCLSILCGLLFMISGNHPLVILFISSILFNVIVVGSMAACVRG